MEVPQVKMLWRDAIKPLAVLLLCAGLALLGSCKYPCIINFVPQADFTASPSSGVAPLVVAFDASGSSDMNTTCCKEITSYVWAFGDGETGSGRTPTHDYEVPGIYYPTLTVTDSCGASDSTSAEITVNGAPRIFAGLVLGYGICTSGNAYCDGAEAAGAPDEVDPWTGRFISLGGNGGYIIAIMQERFTNGAGPDLRIYEVGDLQGGVDEGFDVWISADGVDWVEVASNVRNDPGRVYASIDLAPHSGEFVQVKIVDRGSAVGRAPGADIDAIEALHRG
jgi:PKD repeat protein